MDIVKSVPNESCDLAVVLADIQIEGKWMQTGNIWTAIALVCALGANGNANPKKIVLDEETSERIEREYRVFNERNAKKMANFEITSQITMDPSELFENQQAVSLPICDYRKPPFGWRFVAPSENERELKFVGGRFSSKIIRWTDSIWVRISGNDQKFRRGMYCGAPFISEPSIENYIPVEIDNGFAENIRSKNTPSEFIDGTILHLAAKAPASLKMRAQVQFGLTSQKPIQVGLEIWSMQAKEIKMLSSVWKEVANAKDIHRLVAEATIEPSSQVHLIFRFHPKTRDEAANGENTGTVYLLDATLAPTK